MNKNHKIKKQFTFTGNMKVELFTVHRQNTELRRIENYISINNIFS